MNYYLAVDIGAASGRHMLGHVENGKICLEEMYRFENNLIEKNGHLCWDTSALFDSIIKGMQACKAAGKIPVTMGIDTWAVDFALLDANDNLIGDTVAYRDKRTEGMKSAYPFDELYAKTGIQYQPFNTVYQLLALKKEAPQLLQNAQSLLMIPDYFGFLLTGVKKQEYTNATSTALVNAAEKTWDMPLIDALGLPQKLFGELSMPKTAVGNLSDEIKNKVGFDCTVVLPATHDTGSAFLAVPARDDNAVYISSGTWSLLGVENEAPLTSPQSAAANFTNEGGFEYRYRYLKNIMGLWMIQSIRRNLDKKYSFAELEQMAREAGGFDSIVDVNDESFLAPTSMIDAVKAYCEATNQAVPSTIGETVQCVYKSLALGYAEAIKQLSALTGKKYTSINIVGGGSKDGYLNELTAKATGLTVFAGPTEGTALGNLMAQMIAKNEYKSLHAARAAIKLSFEIKEIKP
ncbi:MAG: rhamnulokinase [Ruminococcaceae bacterium]|nr:rhamnulokinase [Oscillospiraceae bacterium]